MKTHELAKLLQQLSTLLLAAQNIDLRDAKVVHTSEEEAKDKLAVSLSTLVELSRIDRSQWIALIEDNGFPIQIRPRDASRDILGKLLSYLEQNEEARKKLRNRVVRKSNDASPDLMRALASLLGEEH